MIRDKMWASYCNHVMENGLCSETQFEKWKKPCTTNKNMLLQSNIPDVELEE
jgi:hypothetical protein